MRYAGGMVFSLLPSRVLLRLSGGDTLSFLQGLVTTDVTRLPQARAQYAALLTPQGKFLYAFFLLWQDGAVLLDVDAGRAASLLQRLRLYRLRAQVDIAPLAGRGVAVCGPEEAAALPAGAVADPRHPGLGFRMAVEAPAAVQGGGADAYDRLRLSLGIPDEAVDMTPERSFPLAFGFEDLQAVDFRKGCYVGQEVTARMKHLGRLRRCLYQVRGPLPASGTPLTVNGEPAGEMLSGRDGVGLALLQAEPAEAHHAAAYDGGVLSAALPSWFRSALAA